jgi:nucleoside 2-deoxyribosyltransferase
MLASRKFQVFVSSTFVDLKDERQAAVSAILKAGHIPAGMELFTAGNHSQLQTIYRWIDQCDIYMLILGGRYGSVEPESGLSYTELEYNYATAAEKPVFAVVIEDTALAEKVRSHGAGVLETENAASLRTFRKLVLSKSSSFFTDSKDIKLCVHESLSDLVADNELVGWVHASEVPDNSILLGQIEELRVENKRLSAEVSRKSDVGGRDVVDFEALSVLLKSMTVTVPADVAADEEEFENDLLQIFISNHARLITGVTNQMGSGPVSSFYYFNVFPKLQVHGLAANEKVVGVKYRRSYVTEKGLSFLAYMQMQKISKESSVIG